ELDRANEGRVAAALGRRAVHDVVRAEVHVEKGPVLDVPEVVVPDPAHRQTERRPGRTVGSALRNGRGLHVQHVRGAVEREAHVAGQRVRDHDLREAREPADGRVTQGRVRTGLVDLVQLVALEEQTLEVRAHYEATLAHGHVRLVERDPRVNDVVERVGGVLGD